MYRYNSFQDKMITLDYVSLLYTSEDIVYISVNHTAPLNCVKDHLLGNLENHFTVFFSTVRGHLHFKSLFEMQDSKEFHLQCALSYLEEKIEGMSVQKTLNISKACKNAVKCNSSITVNCDER